MKDGRIVVNAWNGRHGRHDHSQTQDNNICETPDGNTRNDVLHSEANLLAFAAKFGLSTDGCDLYVTLSPCANCALLLIQSGIKSVYYLDEYRKPDGIKILKDAGILVKCIKEIM